ncbi:hypothetical protein DL89DRAFT_295254 [Linderina pennispora]|uniref:Uncharacterized protein n=1 Tax=Linderina pennispora TaxID=61395 RepID=A0A1Y1W1A8_9FUNG|nr:uncharacterized protein DL89DRAFT_295254 [Linderina pennispora]ORX66904.1 hypothetical protein DL89DRAFT_295254 [Linderina pennispora]
MSFELSTTLLARRVENMYDAEPSWAPSVETAEGGVALVLDSELDASTDADAGGTDDVKGTVGDDHDDGVDDTCGDVGLDHSPGAGLGDQLLNAAVDHSEGSDEVGSDIVVAGVGDGHEAKESTTEGVDGEVGVADSASTLALSTDDALVDCKPMTEVGLMRMAEKMSSAGRCGAGLDPVELANAILDDAMADAGLVESTCHIGSTFSAPTEEGAGIPSANADGDMIWASTLGRTEAMSNGIDVVIGNTIAMDPIDCSTAFATVLTADADGKLAGEGQSERSSAEAAILIGVGSEDVTVAVGVIDTGRALFVITCALSDDEATVKPFATKGEDVDGEAGVIESDDTAEDMAEETAEIEPEALSQAKAPADELAPAKSPGHFEVVSRLPVALMLDSGADVDVDAGKEAGGVALSQPNIPPDFDPDAASADDVEAAGDADKNDPKIPGTGEDTVDDMAVVGDAADTEAELPGVSQAKRLGEIDVDKGVASTGNIAGAVDDWTDAADGEVDAGDRDRPLNQPNNAELLCWLTWVLELSNSAAFAGFISDDEAASNGLSEAEEVFGDGVDDTNEAVRAGVEPATVADVALDAGLPVAVDRIDRISPISAGTLDTVVIDGARVVDTDADDCDVPVVPDVSDVCEATEVDADVLGEE